MNELLDLLNSLAFNDSVDDSFNDLGNLDDLFDNSWNYDDLFNDFLYFDNPWDLHHLFDDLVDVNSHLFDSLNSS